MQNMSNNTRKLKVGIIVDNAKQPYLVNDLYQNSLRSSCYSIEALIIQNKKKIKKNFFKKIINYTKRNEFKSLIERILFEIITKIETNIIKKKDIFKKIFVNHPISKFNVQKIYVKPDVSGSGLFHRYNNSDIEKIKKLNLDLIIRGSSGILKGEILNICRLGIISFHHGDINLNRNGPPGFWEVYNQESSTGFIIHLLKGELNDGCIIFSGKIATSFLYILNKCRLYLKSSIFLHQIIEKLSHEEKKINIFLKIPYSYSLYNSPNYRECIIYLFKSLSILIKKFFGKFLGFKYTWYVAYQFTKNWKNIFFEKFIIIKNPTNRFLADPFVIKHKDRTILFVEDFCFKSKKGVISAYEIKNNGYKKVGVAIDEKFHLSYPFLIKDKNNIFMIPESNEKEQIRIYKCLKFPLKWKLEKILMENVRAVDTNIIKFNNNYWMFTNIDSSKSGDHSSELHIFYSKDLISKNWKPHKNNPVIFDSNQARNGGIIFSKSNNIFRVFQRQGFDMYGKSLGISEIKILDKNNYKEEILKIVEPKFFKNLKGTHSFCFNKNILTIDFVKYQK
jgi:hypothetical protein